MIRSRLWVLLFGGGTLGLAALLIGVRGLDGPSWAGIGVLAGYLALYLAVGRRAQDGDAPALVFTAGSVLAAGALTAIEPSLANSQFLAMPSAWVLASSWRAGVLANVAIAVSVSGGFLLSLGTAPEALAQLALIEAISAAFSIAIGTWIWRISALSEERQQLVDRLTAAQEELVALHRDRGVTAERARLARELHDTTAQSLTGIVMLAQRARRELGEGALDDGRLQLIEESAHEALILTRSIVAASAPVELADGGLVAALTRLVLRVERESGIDLGGGVDVVSGSDAQLPARDDEVVLLRAAQEGLANVRKHSGARSAAVTVAFDRLGSELVVADEGAGLGRDPREAEAAGFGLAGPRERLALVGGRLVLEESAPGTARPGTVLRAWVPRRDGAGSDAGAAGTGAAGAGAGGAGSSAGGLQGGASS